MRYLVYLSVRNGLVKLVAEDKSFMVFDVIDRIVYVSLDIDIKTFREMFKFDEDGMLGYDIFPSDVEMDIGKVIIYNHCNNYYPVIFNTNEIKVLNGYIFHIYFEYSDAGIYYTIKDRIQYNKAIER